MKTCSVGERFQCGAPTGAYHLHLRNLPQRVRQVLLEMVFWFARLKNPAGTVNMFGGTCFPKKKSHHK